MTTQEHAWREVEGPELGSLTDPPNVIVVRDAPKQVIDGFGASFNELGWTSLAVLDQTQRDDIFREIFAPGVGAGLSLCRMPVGANDFSRDWYSYDEVPDDFSLDHFTIDNDLETLVPFIRAAQREQPDLRIWASPWSPPSWMKRNGHYAAALPEPFMNIVENGLRPDQIGTEGTDMFILDEPHLKAYADYFGRFVDDYRELGIPISMVMPQNEFNSTQVFPSCAWTPDGLAQFLHHLGPEMAARGVEVFLGTLERPDDRLLGDVLHDSQAAEHVSGLGVQWAGRGAIAALHRLHPELKIYQTEQECGDGRNDWRHARYAWSLMKHFFTNGANAYMYWNISLLEGGRSRWGWTQNSLVVVDADEATYRYSYEYQVLKHVSAFVNAGARALDCLTYSGYANQLAFLNPDGSIVLVMQNDMAEDMPVRVLLGGRVIAPTLPADSFSTFVIPAA
ncbi:glycoside hydrolase family 30 beta sandwich domain-containing protein [Microbacterium invictum]|uniref:Glucosylceramidase n=1 Tax=Microbacterium invictum TaxID=515415 RepID=A0AA40SSA3_9MICO|nr:glycoside hydrolase family 30 beta sandwich domain-containing protein [Microbacterium invictum]MBB4141324.1 glucosylceramidase [Microbacterium invictum]